ncbi:proteasome subunit alpha type-3-like [Xenia sp. Carnegie-2017]|uniref:proteasome subunit alpha type-3-like n=1 Tax=Xenia sp. Carnegie-2017 TaxID=2897299 RepID=UPI001F03E799|nr:proteasome subunit alpha type-3-like [Xenia sp. Carnegie-2017]
MSSIGTGYDLSASQFSPDGRVFQVEYAQKAVENSGSVVGLKCKDGVVFGVEKLVKSKLYELSSNRRIFTIDTHIGMAVAGLLADARKIVSVARKEAADYRSDYGSEIPLKFLASRVASHVHTYTLYSFLRPFGCGVMLSSIGQSGPELYLIDPSGVTWGYHGCAIGKAKQAAKTAIEKLKLTELTSEEAVKEIAKIIYTVHDEVKDKNFVLEMSWITEATGGKHQWIPEEIIDAAEKHAKESAMEEDSSDDDDDL